MLEVDRIICRTIKKIVGDLQLVARNGPKGLSYYYYYYYYYCVRVGNDVSEWFPVNVGLIQGCVMSPWLFNVYLRCGSRGEC